MRRSKRKAKTIRKRILILCEGLTEKNYFQALKEDPELKILLSALHPQVVAAKNPTPEQVVNEAKKRVAKEALLNNPYDRVWVVFDHDHHEHRERAYLEAEKEGFGIAFSAISFEFWYLLHFKKISRSFASSGALISFLRKFYPEYEKTKQNDFANLKEKLPDALLNAKWLRKQVHDIRKHLVNHSAWTDVDKLISELTTIY